MAMAREIRDEEVGLLSGEVRLARRGARSGTVTERLAEVWRQPIGSATQAPQCLKRRLVFTDAEQDLISQLRTLAEVPFTAGEPGHEQLLRRYFVLTRSEEEAKTLPETGKDPRWKELGFQAQDPRTDFRGGGLLALQNMVFLAEAYPELTARMISEARGNAGKAEYLFSAACVNVSGILVLLLGLNAGPSMSPVPNMPCPVHPVARKNFATLLRSQGASPAAAVFGELFSRAVLKLHDEWSAVCSRKLNANLLDFGQALGVVAESLEHLLNGLGRRSELSLKEQLEVLDTIRPEGYSAWFSLHWNRFESSVLCALSRFTALLAEILPVPWRIPGLGEVL